MTDKPIRLAGPAIHPGEILAEELAALGASASDVARAIGVPVNRITEILHRRRSVTADTALRLGRWFGTGPEIWLSLQQDFDLRVARREIGSDLRRINRHRGTVRAA